MSDDLTNMLLSVCGRCRRGAGGECHTPGCAFWMNRAPDIPLTALHASEEAIKAGTRAVAAVRREHGYRSAAQGVAEAVLIAAEVIASDGRMRPTGDTP